MLECILAIAILSVCLLFHENGFSDNFDSNIGAQRLVNTEKFTFKVDNLRKRRRKRAAMTVCDDVMCLAYRRHELIFMTSIGYGLA